MRTETFAILAAILMILTLGLLLREVWKRGEVEIEIKYLTAERDFLEGVALRQMEEIANLKEIINQTTRSK